MDLHVRSTQLLERLANSIYDRDAYAYEHFAFSVKEIQIVEEWLKEVINEIKKPAHG